MDIYLRIFFEKLIQSNTIGDMSTIIFKLNKIDSINVKGLFIETTFSVEEIFSKTARSLGLEIFRVRNICQVINEYIRFLITI